jgi:hypothetical protein
MHRGLLTRRTCDYAIRAGAPLEVVENLQSIEDEGEIYESMEEIWPDYLLTKIIFGMRMNIKKKPRKKVSKRLFFFGLITIKNN